MYYLVLLPGLRVNSGDEKSTEVTSSDIAELVEGVRVGMTVRDC